MKKIKIYHDKKGNTLTIWFGDSTKEEVCEEIGEDIVLMKDKKGRVIGIEKLNYVVGSRKDQVSLPVEVSSI